MPPLDSNNEHVSIKIDDIKVDSSDCENYLKENLTQNLILRLTWMELLRNPVNVFPGITTFFIIAKPKPLMNPIFTSQLNYSLLIFPLDVS